MGIRAELLLAVSERRWNREAGTEFHVDHELTVDAHVEGKPIRIMNREVGHDFRKAPDRATSFQSEGLIDQHVVNKPRLDPGGLTITLVLNSWYSPRSPSMKCARISATAARPGR